MNDNLDFWRIWEKSEKAFLFTILYFIVFLSLGLLLMWSKGLENIIHWDSYQVLKEKIYETSVPLINNLAFTKPDIVWFVDSYYQPSLVKVNVYWFWALLGFSTLGVSLILAGLSKLNNVYFLIGALVLGGFLMSLRIENIFLQTHSYVFLGTYALVGLVYFGFNSIWKNKSSIFRTLVFLAIFLGLYFLAFKYGKINEVLPSLAANSLFSLGIFTFIFIFFTGHEFYSGFLWLLSQTAQKGKSTLVPFFIMTAVVAANFLLIYLENTKTIAETSYIIPPVFLFIIQVFLGLWGFRKFLDQTEIFSFNQIGYFLYLGFAIISLSTVGFIYAIANDPLQDLFEDTVAIASLVMSLVFFVYTLINFISVLKQGLPFHKVIYKAPFSKLYFSRTAGFFLILFLFSFKGLYSLYQFKAGLSNTLGDFSLLEGDKKMAETYYQNAQGFDMFNHKSNLSLASLALAASDKVAAAAFYNQSLQKKPTALAYAGLSTCLETENMFFESIFTLQKGIAAFPEDSHLYTNLAKQYEKANQRDSLYLNLVEAQKLCPSCEVENSNLLAFWIKYGKPETHAEYANKVGNSPSESANIAALAKLAGTETKVKISDWPKDSALSVSQLAFLANSSVNSKNTENLSAKNIDFYRQKLMNASDQRTLSFAYAMQHLYRENPSEGIKELSFLAQNASAQVKDLIIKNQVYFLLQKGAFNKAMETLEKYGDPASASLLRQSNLAQTIASTQLETANNLGKTLSLKNYQAVLNKEGFNPYLIAQTADFLVKNKKAKEAYDLTFYSSDFIGEHPLVLEANFKAAVELYQFEFAEEVLAKLKGKSPNLAALQNLLLAKRNSQGSF